MANKNIVGSRLIFKPLHSISYVLENGTTNINPESIKVELVGEKAFGLSCLPKLWTLPFIVASDTLLSQYIYSSESIRSQLLENWSNQIILAALSVGIKEQDNIIVRSSGYAEGLEERGKFYSVEGRLLDLINPLKSCLQKLSVEKSSKNQKIPLIIQKHVISISAKGHLSNERRCYEEKRDWLGEFEDTRAKITPFEIKIPLRNWRKKIVTVNYTKESLICNLSAHVSEVLKIPATWAYERKVRIHFEWVWDGSTIYLVQADQEDETKGIDPTKVYQIKSQMSPSFMPKCLKEINQNHALRYEKIRNVFTYYKLGLPITKLYVLDDQHIIENLASGIVSPDLEADIRELVKGSLVIRIDIATRDKKRRQLLPRTQEERKLDSALNWLKQKSAEIRSEIQDDLVFIFHNFVPAISSAFAYAAPGERKVQIEALWGLPEGLYYNAHDKYIVDTQTPRVNELSIDRFVIIEKRKYKHFFIAPDEDGHWNPKILKPPYDWRGSIQKKEWIKEIALESRRISEEEGKPLSIMWFVNVSREICQRNVFPWYHEYYDSTITNRVQAYRTKTPFDRSLTIRRNDDIEKLRQEAKKPQAGIRHIRIQPCEDDLLRKKSTLRDIGELAQSIGAVILLEGGVLSHAYYQLMQTNAIVQVKHPFEDFEDECEFNKLVRDNISVNIERGGELVDKARLSGESLLRALREKLIEEAFEILDAIDQESIVGELADLNEVIDGILSHINVSRNELEQRQKQKREKAGGFKDGIILLKTRNPLPTKKGLSKVTLYSEDKQEYSINEQKLIDLSYQDIDKWDDKREHSAATEAIMRLVIPVIRDNWNVEKTINYNLENELRIQLTGKRLSSKCQIELSIFTQRYKQLMLFDLINPKTSD